MKTLKEKTATGILWGAMNNGSMQVLGALFGIITARLLSPKDYALVGMLAIFPAVAGAIQESGFTSALVNMKKTEDNDYNSVFWFSLLMGTSLYIILFFCSPLISFYYKQPEIVALSRVSFITIPLSAIGIVPQAYLFKSLKVKEATMIRIQALVASGIVGIVMALNGMAYWSIVWQQIIYVLITSLGKFMYIPWRPSIHIDFKPVRKMFGFSCKIMFTSIINTVSNNILIVIFGRLFPVQAVGNFSQANSWNNKAYSLVSGTVAQVAQPVFSSIDDDKERLRNVFRKMVRFTAFLSFPVMFGLAIISQEFIILAIGSKWAESVFLLQILCISGAFLPLHGTFQNLIISKGRSDLYLWGNIGLLLSSIVLIVALAKLGIVIMIAGYSVLNIGWVVVWQYYAHKLIGLKYIDTLKDIFPFFISALAVMSITYFIASFVDSMVLRLIIKMILSVLIYFTVMKLAKVKMQDECMNYIFHRNK